MALINALNSAISGIGAQQQRIDVIGNNLANVDTTGFKGSRALFQNIMSQTLRFGSAPQGALGGINAMQVGLGVNVAEISRDFSNGSLEATGISTDLALDGDGFFVLKNHAGSEVYTRAGAFSLNPQNTLHNAATGQIVQGWMANFDTFQLPSGGPLTNLVIPVGELTIAKETKNASFDGNLNSAGKVATLGSLLESEQLFDGSVSSSSYADASTLLTDLVRSSTGTDSGNTIDLNVQLGDKIEFSFEKGGRTVTRVFEVGAPPPFGGTTLGDLRDFVEGSLGIATGSSPSDAMISSVRQTQNSANAGQLFVFGGGTLPTATNVLKNDDAIVVDVSSAFGITPQLFYFEDSGAAGYGGTVAGSTLDTGGHTAITLTGGAVTLEQQLDALIDAINGTANANVTAGVNGGLNQVVKAEKVFVGSAIALKITALSAGPNGNLIKYVNDLDGGGAQTVTNLGAGQLQGGTNAVQVNGTIDLNGARATANLRFTGTATTGGNASLFTAGETVTISVPGLTNAITLTASATGPTTGSQFEIYNLGSNATASNLQTIKNLANAINSNVDLAPWLNATVATSGASIDLVLEADNPGATSNGVQTTAVTVGTAAGALPAHISNTGVSTAGGVGALGGGGDNKDTVQVIRNNTDGTVDVAFIAASANHDFVSEGVQVGDFIRFGSGDAAAQIGVVSAVGVDTTNNNAINRQRIEFKMKTDAIIPTAPGGQTWFIHEAAGVSLGTGSGGENTLDLDPASARGSLRVAGNVGKSNELRNLSLVRIASSGARDTVAGFSTLTSAEGESTFTQAVVYDTLGKAHTLNMTFHLEGTSDRGTVWRYIAESEDNTANPGVDINKVVGSGTVEFSTTGQFVRSSPDAVRVNLSSSGAVQPLGVTPNFTGLTAFASDAANTLLGDQTSEVFLSDQDGFEEGVLQDFNISVDGQITGSFTNGLTRSLGRVAVARFNNVGGLIDIGNSTFRAGVNSGTAVVGTPGVGGRAVVRSGFLEESNVDLSAQFTELIVAQRAFQANSRTVGVADTLLQELVNLVR